MSLCLTTNGNGKEFEIKDCPHSNLSSILLSANTTSFNASDNYTLCKWQNVRCIPSISLVHHCEYRCRSLFRWGLVVNSDVLSVTFQKIRTYRKENVNNVLLMYRKHDNFIFLCKDFYSLHAFLSLWMSIMCIVQDLSCKSGE